MPRNRRSLRILTAAGAVSVSLSVCDLAMGYDITTCGQTVPKGEVGIVQADLDCPQGVDARIVTLEPKAQLDLNGHTLNGGAAGVECLGKAPVCTIRGPGVISGSLYLGVFTRIGVRRLVIENVTLSDHEVTAVMTGGARRVELRNVALDRNGLSLVGDPPEILALRGAVENTRRLELENVTGTDNVANVFSAFKIRGANVTLTDNFGGMHSASVYPSSWVPAM